MYKLILTSLIFLSSCSYWNDLEVQGLKNKSVKQKTKKTTKLNDFRDQFIGRYKFAGANIERSTGELVPIKTCPKDSLFIQKNEFKGFSLTFREKGQYFYDNLFFIDTTPPLNWIAEEEDLRTTKSGNRIIQSRKRIRYEGKTKVYLEYLSTIEKVDDLLFYTSKVTSYMPNQIFRDELIPDYLGELHCAYSFDSLTSEQKKAQVRDMGY